MVYKGKLKTYAVYELLFSTKENRRSLYNTKRRQSVRLIVYYPPELPRKLRKKPLLLRAGCCTVREMAVWRS